MENMTMYHYNVTFAGDWGWIGATVAAPDEDTAIDNARDHIHYESGIAWEVICTMPHAEAEYVGEA